MRVEISCGPKEEYLRRLKKRALCRRESNNEDNKKEACLQSLPKQKGSEHKKWTLHVYICFFIDSLLAFFIMKGWFDISYVRK